MDSRRRRRRPSSATSSGISCASTLCGSPSGVSARRCSRRCRASARRPSASSRRAPRGGVFVRPRRAARDAIAAAVSSALIKLARWRRWPSTSRRTSSRPASTTRRPLLESLRQDDAGPHARGRGASLPIRRVAELDRFARSAQPSRGSWRRGRRCRLIRRARCASRLPCAAQNFFVLDIRDAPSAGPASGSPRGRQGRARRAGAVRSRRRGAGSTRRSSPRLTIVGR